MNDGADRRSAPVLLRGGALVAGGAWFALLGVVAADRWFQAGVLLFVAVVGWVLLASVVALGLALAIGAMVTARRGRASEPVRYRWAGVLLASWVPWVVVAAVLFATLDG